MVNAASCPYARTACCPSSAPLPPVSPSFQAAFFFSAIPPLVLVIICSCLPCTCRQPVCTHNLLPIFSCMHARLVAHLQLLLITRRPPVCMHDLLPIFCANAARQHLLSSSILVLFLLPPPTFRLTVPTFCLKPPNRLTHAPDPQQVIPHQGTILPSCLHQASMPSSPLVQVRLPVIISRSHQLFTVLWYTQRVHAPLPVCVYFLLAPRPTVSPSSPFKQHSFSASAPACCLFFTRSRLYSQTTCCPLFVSQSPNRVAHLPKYFFLLYFCPASADVRSRLARRGIRAPLSQGPEATTNAAAIVFSEF
jgi:hypothetical protein